MPLPKPKENETEKDFIARCIPLVIEADDLDAEDKDDRAQATAICYSQWRRAHGEEEEGKSLAVKYLRDDEGGAGAIVGGPLLLWGSPKQRDLQGEYFTPETQTWHEVYKSVPALFHHGLDDVVGLAVIGRRIKAEVRGDGLWVEDWLDKSSKYWAMVKPLLEAEALYYSPGSAPHLVEKAEDGRLTSFPVVEDTLTPVPAQHRLRPIEQIKAAYLKADLDVPDTLEPEQDPAASGDDGGPSCSEADRAKARAIQILAEVETMEV